MAELRVTCVDDVGKQLSLSIDTRRSVFSVDFRLSASCDARLELTSDSSRQRPFLDRTHWPPLKASIKPEAFILPGEGMGAGRLP